MSRVPRIRFKGFKEDWEQRKLGEYLIQYTEVTIINDQYPVLTSSRKGIFFQKDYYDGNQIASENNIGYNIVPYGYFTYRHMSDDEIFYFNINNIIDNGIVSTLYPVFTTNNRLDSKFLQYELNFGKEFRKYSVLQKQGGSRTYMYFNKLRDLKLTITTSLKEQECIRNLICSIDHLITLHQRKFEKLKIIKKSMLENLFPQNGEKTPKIRFSGFTEDWEQRKLISCLSLLKDGTHGTHKDYPSGPLLLSAKNIKNGRVYYDETDRRISYKDFEKIHRNFKLQIGDILLTIVGSIGETALLKDSFEITFQRSVAFLRAKDNILPEFLMTEFNTDRFRNELEDRKSTSAQPGIYLGDLGEIPVFVSKNSAEQRRVGSYFESLDHLITLHQSKSFGYIFKAIVSFTLYWEQRKLGEMVEFYNGDRSSRYPNDSDMVFDGIPFINAGDLVLGRVKLDTTNKITEEKYNQLSGAKIQCGDIIYCLRGTLGKNAFVDNFDIGTIASSLVDIRPQKIVGKYLFQVLNSDIEYSQRILNDEGAAQPNLSAKNLYLFDIPIPRDAEQIKIAEYLELLDHLITLHQSKLEKLQKIKKSMLESMFV